MTSTELTTYSILKKAKFGVEHPIYFRGKVILLLILIAFPFSKSKAQIYYNENATNIVISGTSKDYTFYANTLNSTFNFPASIIEFTIKFSAYRYYDDSVNKTMLTKIFDPMVSPAWVFRCNSVAFNQLDKANSNRQILIAPGNLMIGNIVYPINVPLELTFTDKQLQFKMNFSVKLKELGLSIPDEYKDLITGSLDFRVDNGREIVRKQ